MARSVAGTGTARSAPRLTGVWMRGAATAAQISYVLTIRYQNLAPTDVDVFARAHAAAHRRCPPPLACRSRTRVRCHSSVSRRALSRSSSIRCCASDLLTVLLPSSDRQSIHRTPAHVWCARHTRHANRRGSPTVRTAHKLPGRYPATGRTARGNSNTARGALHEPARQPPGTPPTPQMRQRPQEARAPTPIRPSQTRCSPRHRIMVFSAPLTAPRHRQPRPPRCPPRGIRIRVIPVRVQRATTRRAEPLLAPCKLRIVADRQETTHAMTSLPNERTNACHATSIDGADSRTIKHKVSRSSSSKASMSADCTVSAMRNAADSLARFGRPQPRAWRAI